MIELITASAGSGKTYMLAKKYIGILLEAYLKDDSRDAHEFEHILAVTFTNKATSEMKDRILQELFILAENPTLSDYYKDFCSTYDVAIVSDHKTWRRILFTLLHNYSRFSVSTIDTFFQGVLRHFAREIGSYNSYRIELDRDALIAEAADNLLSSIKSSDDVIYKVLRESMEEDMGEGKKSVPSQELALIAKNLMGGEFVRALEALSKGTIYDDFLKEVKTGSDEFSKKVNALESALKADRASVIDHLTVTASKLFACFEKNKAVVNGSYKLAGSIKSLSENIKSKDLSDKALAHLQDMDFFNAKSTPDVEAEFEPLCRDVVALYPRRNRVAELLISIPHLKFAVSVFKEFAELTDSANVKCLEDTTRLLSEIIAGSDAPFIYEKIGTRYNHYLLDEFQDTSHVQWKNFKPLLGEANATGGRNLVVGDVKQSIYRWRNSDYSILDKSVEEAFSASKTPLNSNFRSGKNIVEFNNELFGSLASQLDSKIAEEFTAASKELKDIYLQRGPEGEYESPFTVGQKVTNDFDGFVRFERITGDNKDVIADEIYQKTIDQVVDLLEKGVRGCDILILVRKNAEGIALAEGLLRAGVSVSSDESLLIVNNPIARKVIAVLRYLDNRNDKISKSVAEDAGFDLSSTSTSLWYSTLVELCEKIIAKLRKSYEEIGGMDEFRGSIPYLSSLVDIASAYETNYGNSLHNFIAYLDHKDGKIASSASDETVRIMTIHKSKGLDGEFVIVPFINKVEYCKNSASMWSECDEGKLDPEYEKFAYYASLKKTSAMFHDAYAQEYKLSCIDAINILYVAFTRARHGLFMIDGHNVKHRSGHILSDFIVQYLLEEYADECKESESGLEYERGSLDATITDYLTPREESNLAKKRLLDELGRQSVITSDYAVYQSRGAVRNSLKATDFFEGLSEEAGAPAKDSRVKGILQHDILSAVHTVDDVDAAVEAKWQEGILDITREEAVEYLEGRINGVSEYGWFAPEASVSAEEAMLVKVSSLARGETPIATRMLPDGSAEYIVNRRPDRIVEHPDGSVSIVDYKFTGEPGANLPHYRKQVEAYCSYYRALPGNASKIIRGYIWYVNADQVAEV